MDDDRQVAIIGTDIPGVYEATDFLMRGNVDSGRLSEEARKPLEIGRRVVVIGGGQSAADCLRAALKFGSEDVTCLCNCAENEIPDEMEPRKALREEGVKYRFLTQPVKFIAGADGKLAAVECVELKLGEPDANGCRKLEPVEGSNFSVAADTAIINTGIFSDQTLLGEKSEAKEEILTSGDKTSSPDPVTPVDDGK